MIDKHFVEWLGTQRLPMFDISRTTQWMPASEEAPKGWFWHSGTPEERERYANGYLAQGWLVWQKAPKREAFFECELDELQPLIAQHFKQLATPIGVLAVNTAIDDLRLEPWWGSAGPQTEEIRYLLREGFKLLPQFVRHQVLKTPIKTALDHKIPVVANMRRVG